MKNVRERIAAFRPQCEQEARDQAQMLRFLDTNTGWLTRDNAVAHVTASAWVVNPARESVLMAYHNIYQSWSWLGGHADGDSDLLAVAIRETEEETGAKARPVREDVFSLESLCVEGHVKRGAFVSPHIHMNVTFLLEADDTSDLRGKPDENRGVMWIPFERIAEKCSEPYMRIIYDKLTRRV